MKKLCTLLLAISFITMANAQLDLDNGRWVNDYTIYHNPLNFQYTTHYTNYCTYLNDTIIGNYVYRKLFKCPDSIYKGALRNDSANNRVYYVAKDSITEQLLYDFGLKVGDTVTNYYVEWWDSDTMVVRDIDTINYNGRDNIHIYFNDIYGWSTVSASWVIGVGCTQGFLQSPFGNISDFGLSLNCYSKNDTSYYPDYQYGACRLDLSIDEINTLEKIEIFPNPTTSLLNIKRSSSETALIKLYNTAGVLLLEMASTEVQQQLDISTLPPATYLLTVETDGILESRKIIKMD